MAIRGLLLLLLWSVAPMATAKEVAGVRVPDRVQLGAATELALNGAGVRSRFFVKVYVGALYLPAPSRDAMAILGQRGPVAMHMHFLHGEVSAEKLRAAWSEGFTANLAPAELAALKARIERFNALFRSVRRGEVVRLEYRPGAGTVVAIDGDERGTIEGEDFMQAWLRIWLGEQPADAALKRALLGGD